MNNIFLCADLHLGHQGSCKWLNADGQRIRPFENAEEMDEALVENWNNAVGEHDKVYVLGDVAMKRSAIATMGRLNGKKVLVKGNHDIFPLKDYLPYFYDVRGTHKLDNFILSHIPIHEDSLARWCGGNIHGHLHDGRVMTSVERSYWDWTAGVAQYKQTVEIDPRYYCVSVEHTNYTPISFEDVKKVMKEQREN